MAIELFELDRVDETRFAWSPSPLLMTPAALLQGGAGLGAALSAMQIVSDRPTIWGTAQYLSFAATGEPIDISVAVEVSGRNTTQARCVLARDGVEILTAHAALGARSSEIDGVWVERPAVPAPDDCEPYRIFERGRGDGGDLVEFRLAQGRQLHDIDRQRARGDGRSALWARCWEGRRPVRVPDLTFLGDFMPVGFAHAIGKTYFGNSLDNTIRVGELVDSEWILLSVNVQQIANGFGYGRAELWSDDGHLLGEVSQSAILRHRSKMG